MPPAAMRSRISYCPKRSGPDEGTAAAGSSRRRGAGGGTEAGGGVAPAGRAFGIARPESVSSIIRSTSVSDESFGRGGAAGGRAGGVGVPAGGVLSDGARGAAAGFDGISPESVSRSRFSMSDSAAGRTGGGIGGGAAGGGGAGGGTDAAAAGAT